MRRNKHWSSSGKGGAVHGDERREEGGNDEGKKGANQIPIAEAANLAVNWRFSGRLSQVRKAN